MTAQLSQTVTGWLESEHIDVPIPPNPLLKKVVPKKAGPRLVRRKRRRWTSGPFASEDQSVSVPLETPKMPPEPKPIGAPGTVLPKSDLTSVEKIVAHAPDSALVVVPDEAAARAARRHAASINKHVAVAVRPGIAVPALWRNVNQ